MPVDYDAWRPKSRSERLAIFNSIMPEEQAELVSKHIAHFLAIHRVSLTASQIEILEECVAAVTPEMYAVVPNPEALDRARQLEKRASALLTRDQMREALTLHVPPEELENYV